MKTKNEFIRNRVDRAVLIHGSGERKNHKYIARVKTKNGDRWRYFYSQKEYNAYLKKSGDNFEESVVQEYDDDGKMLSSTRTKRTGDNEKFGIGLERIPTTSRTEKFNYDANGNLSGKEVTNTTDSLGNYDQKTDYYLYKGQTFIDKILKSKGVWQKLS